jgi:hypothetical protein
MSRRAYVILYELFFFFFFFYSSINFNSSQCQGFKLPDDRFRVALGLAEERDMSRLFTTFDTQQFGVGRQFRTNTPHRFYSDNEQL